MMVGPPLISPDGPHLDYEPSAAVLATFPSTNPNLRHLPEFSGPPKEQFDPEIPGVVLRAASIPDIRILRGLLRHEFPATNYIVGPLEGPWESALTNAIRACLPNHTKLLLEQGANPNGFPDRCFDVASTRFFRGRHPRETLTGGCYLRTRASTLDDMRRRNLGSASPESYYGSGLTDSELEQRHRSRSRFWAEPDFPRIDYPTNNPMPALCVATKFHDQASYDLLVKFGADETAWIAPGQQTPLSSDDDPSSVDAHASSRWAVESPLLVAVSNRDVVMLRMLLDRGHKPEYFPEALVTRSMSALAAALSKHDPLAAHEHHQPWTVGFDMMAPKSDMSLLTPLFRCHVLHFAVATLDLNLIKHVTQVIGGDKSAAALQQVPSTALGHTLLHIASLPIHDGVVNMHSEAVYLSSHEFRTTDTSWEPRKLSSEARSSPAARGGIMRGRRTGTWRGRGGRNMVPSTQPGPESYDVPQNELRAQADVVIFLMQCLQEGASSKGAQGQDELAKQDVHGNTPMHYLASIRNPDWELISQLVNQYPDGGTKKAWESLPNMWGFTAERLYDSGQAAKRTWDQEYMSFWKNE